MYDDLAALAERGYDVTAVEISGGMAAIAKRKLAGELERSPLFADTAERRYEWEATYTTAIYLDLLRTYSGHRALPDRPAPDCRTASRT